MEAVKKHKWQIESRLIRCTFNVSAKKDTVFLLKQLLHNIIVGSMSQVVLKFIIPEFVEGKQTKKK